MKKFITKAAEQLLQTHGNNLADVLVLMPNQRGCTYLRNTLQQLAQGAILAPEITTLQNWMLSHSDMVVADSIELVTELYACHKAIGGTNTLDDFIGLANVMLDDFNRIDMQMADSKLLFKNLENLQSMKMYEPGEDEPDEYKIRYRKFWEDFGALYHALRERLLADKKGYTGLILREVAANVKAIHLEQNAIYLVGFNGLDKVDEVVIEHLQRQYNTTLIWDADKYYVADEMMEAGYYTRKYLSKLRIKKEDIVDEIRTGPKKLQVIGAAKNIGQVKVVADILQHKLQINETNALDTVVVVPDEKLLSPLLANIPANIPSLNITMGLNIGGSSSATWLDILFRLYSNGQKYESKQGVKRYYYRDVFELLQHSFFHILFGRTNTDAFVQEMKKQNRILIRREELEKILKEHTNTVLFGGEDAQGFAAYLQHILGLLIDKLIKRARGGNTSLATEAEIAFRLQNILNNTESIFRMGDDITIKTYIALLRENFRNERVPLEGDPVQGLQIMGLHETRSLDFKNVIFLSANEGILPSGKSTKTYIPFELQAEFLTTYRERDSTTAYLFYRLLQKAENVFILYNTEPDELGGGEKSRYILQLEAELPKANAQATIEDMVFAVDPPANVEEQPIVIEKNEAIMEKLDKLLLNTEQGMSPSALNTYINCTLQYYFRYVAGLREQDDMEESLEASTIGSAVHYALEHIYKDRLDTPIQVEYLKAALADKARIEHLVNEELKARFDNESLTRGKNLLLYKVCVKLVEEFLKAQITNVETLDDSGAEMRVEMLEGRLAHSINIRGKEVTVQGKIDRIEKVDDIVQIADYKTSTKSVIPILNDDTWLALFADPKYSKTVQLLVYSWLYYRANGSVDVPIRSGIYWLRDAGYGLDTLRLDKTNDIIDTQTILMFEDYLKKSLSELLDTEVPFTKIEDRERCVYCEFVKICGRD